jgi:hypothetical protein
MSHRVHALFIFIFSFQGFPADAYRQPFYPAMRMGYPTGMRGMYAPPVQMVPKYFSIDVECVATGIMFLDAFVLLMLIKKHLSLIFKALATTTVLSHRLLLSISTSVCG